MTNDPLRNEISAIKRDQADLMQILREDGDVMALLAELAGDPWPNNDQAAHQHYRLLRLIEDVLEGVADQRVMQSEPAGMRRAGL